ncbi:PIN domain-containing protein [Protofrankia symbiont of Coriaria ruscifolia]|uniref:PIN domain-containing protein n=1 Tax=Protofrankia symbiont of Coriaria ruscifolia TaxID=1306542 RepID=UPI0013EFC238
MVDTGPLVAALDADDADHKRCLDLLERHPGPLLVPAPVLTDVCWLLERERGAQAEAAFLDALAADELRLVELQKGDLRRMADLVRRYDSLPLGALDASV